MALTYNDYTFPDFSTKLSLSGSSVYADDDRSVKYVKWTITAEAIAIAEAGEGDVDANDHFDRVRSALLTSGKTLLMTDVGFGTDLRINDFGHSGSITDVNYGPNPGMTTWLPVGNENAVEFTWTCDIHIPEECDATGGLDGIVAFNYSASFSINEKGFTTRTVTGFIEISGYASGSQPQDSADNYRDQIIVTQPPNFRRKQDYVLSEDKRKLTFTIVDTEIESGNAYPEGVTKISGKHGSRINADSRARVDHTLNVKIDLRQDQPRRLAWDIFKVIWAARISHPVSNGLTIMLEHFDIDEDLFGTEIGFSCGYRVMTDDILDIVTGMGHFTTLDYDWTDWATSMAGVTDSRGLAELGFDESDDKIVSICDQILPTIGPPHTVPVMPGPGTADTICNTYPDADKSYVHFKSTLMEDTNYGKSFAVELGPVTSTPLEFDASTDYPELSVIDGVDDLETTIAERAPVMKWRWTGYAERLGYPIPTPDLISIDGITLEKVGQHKAPQRHKGMYFCVPLYAMAWDFEYRVTTRPTQSESDTVDPNYDS